MELSRRAFLESTLSVAALAASARIASRYRLPHATLAVYDSRFPDALALARALAPGSEPSPVGGDATALAVRLQRALEVAGHYTVRGVTPESIPFCLHQLASPALRTALEIRRLDRDLFAWKLQLWRR